MPVAYRGARPEKGGACTNGKRRAPLKELRLEKKREEQRKCENIVQEDKVPYLRLWEIVAPSKGGVIGPTFGRQFSRCSSQN